ncbi:MAG: Hsp20/alpha crystallin family protein [Eubacterium sp.]|nr:Hsp20/alpha crystallin family protein [Eubacterium sp.]MCM1417678.1 Hsp20/alpha crystallin family protein [Roseburia sp.]
MFGLTPYERNAGFFDAFGSFANDFFAESRACKTDVRDEGERYVLEAELPGFKKDDIRLDIRGDRLTLSAERSEEDERKDREGRYIRRERSFGSYTRSFDLSGIAADRITAEYKSGVLTLTLPKTEEQPVRSRRLEIR